MSKNRFEFLVANMRFDDKNTRDTRKAEDKFAAFREIWSVFEGNCSRYYSPSEYLTIDETLLSFRGRYSFRMYIPSKPDKYGLKIVSLCDVRKLYFISGIPYVGKENPKKKRIHRSLHSTFST
ncbi:piggyBac transposable element-derived protein 3-like [Belonocnema kinseyi]|uniref:piggyBac transposable element-derived protein 3-like n=1 Tax=Belonocnema kinseyi TaxID=2817044 RepID=UPI00143D9465|nr:piggyBac transposable element-derived protein 3-like [Belonocnema kinseyi]